MKTRILAILVLFVGLSLYAEAPQNPANAEGETKEGYLTKIQSKVEKTAKGKESKVSDFVGDQLSKLPIPDQALGILNLTIKDMSVVKAPHGAKIKGGLGFSGTTVFNNVQTKLTVYAFVDTSNNPKAAIELMLPDQYSLADMFTSMKGSVIEKLKMPNGVFAISNIDYTPDNGFTREIGFNFNAELHLSGPLEIISDLKNQAGKVQGMVVEGGQAFVGGVIPKDVKSFKLKADIPIKIGVDFVALQKAGKVSKSVSDVFKRITTKEFGVSAAPADRMLSAYGAMEFVLGTQPQPLEFRIMGSVEPNLVSIAGEMNGKLDLKWVAIGDLGLQIDIDQAVLPAAAAVGLPFTGLGIKGAIDLGKEGSRAQLAAASKVSIKSASTPDLLFDVEGNNLDLGNFIVFLSKIAKKPIESAKMPPIKFKQVKGYLATETMQIGSTTYQRGVEVNVEGQLIKQTIRMTLFVDPSALEIRGDGYLSPIDLKIIKITGAGPDKIRGTADDGAAVSLNINAKNPLAGRFYITGQLEIPPLKISQQTDINFEGKAFEATLENTLADILKLQYTIKIDPTKPKDFYAGFSFKAGLSEFLSGKAKQELNKLQQDGDRKAKEAQEKWKVFNDDVAAHKRKLSELKTKFNKARQDVRDALKIEQSKAKCQENVRQCKSGKVGKCLGIPFSECTAYAAKEIGKTISDAAIGVAAGVIEGYKEAVGAFEKLNRELEKQDFLVKLTKIATQALKEITSFFASITEVIQVKEARGHVSGDELLQAKLPMLEVLNIRLQIPSKIPVIGGQGISIALKNLQFDFKNPGKSLESIGGAIGKMIEGWIKGESPEDILAKQGIEATTSPVDMDKVRAALPSSPTYDPSVELELSADEKEALEALKELQLLRAERKKNKEAEEAWEAQERKEAAEKAEQEKAQKEQERQSQAQAKEVQQQQRAAAREMQSKEQSRARDQIERERAARDRQR